MRRRGALVFAVVVGVVCAGLMAYAWQQPVPDPLPAPIEHPMVLFGILSAFCALTAVLALALTQPDRSAAPEVVLARLDTRLRPSWIAGQALFAGAWGVIYAGGMFAIVVVVRDPAPWDSPFVSIFVLLMGFGGISAAAIAFVADVVPRVSWTWFMWLQGIQISELDVRSAKASHKYGQLVATLVKVMGPDGSELTLHLMGDKPPLYGTRGDVVTVFVATPAQRPSHYRVISADGAPFRIHPG